MTPAAGTDRPRRLVAALAARLRSTRLYGKPLQPLAPGHSILREIVETMRTFDCIDDVVLGIADGPANEPLVVAAEELECGYVCGAEADVCGRLIACGHHAGATDLLRKTTEDPFIDGSSVADAWAQHVRADNDVTVVDYLPEGAAYEIVSLDALTRSSRLLDPDHREHALDGIRLNQSDFQVEILTADDKVRRPDLRMTIDTPEDLILARAVWSALSHHAPAIPLKAIIEFLDAHPELTNLVAPYASGAPVWDLGTEEG